MTSSTPHPGSDAEPVDWAELFGGYSGALWQIPEYSFGSLFPTPAERLNHAATAAQLAVDWTLATLAAVFGGNCEPVERIALTIHEFLIYVAAGAETETDYYQERP